MTAPLGLLVTTFIEAVLQVVVFAGIPLIVYAIMRRRVRGFLAWIGLKAAPLSIIGLAFAISAALAAVKLWLVWDLLLAPKTVSGAFLAFFEEHGWSVLLVVAVLIAASLKTALAEEIFFRGFVGERLMRTLGFQRGNILQALIFGLVHLPLLFVMPEGQRAIGPGLLIVVNSAISAWIMGYLNHVKADGSILPSVTMHATGNTIAYMMPMLLA